MTHTRLLPALTFAASLLFLPLAGSAHPGHDEAPEPAAATGSPRTEAHSDDFELVAVAAGPHALTIWLDRFATNEPLPGGSVEVADGVGDAVRAEPQEDGTYVLRAPWLEVPGKHDLTFTVAAGDASDLLTATIELPQAGHAATTTASSGGRVREMLGDRAGPVTVALAFLLGVLTVVAVQARGRWRTVSGATAILVGVAIGGVAFAHGGVDDGDSPAPVAIVANAPRRQPDGSVSMPKDAQRLLAVRTVLSAETKA